MSTIKANTLLHSDGSTTTQPSIPALDQRMAKAWINFNGTGTIAIRSSYGVSSIADVSTGKYTVNFSTNMPNVNYATVASYGGHEPSGGQGVRTPFNTGDQLVGSTNMNVGNQNSDSPVMSVVIFST